MTDNTIDPCEEAKAMNFARAKDAETALNAFVQAKEQREGEIGSIPDQNRPEYLVDLLVDLRHWARREKLDFDRCDAEAKEAFLGEVEEEDQGIVVEIPLDVAKGLLCLREDESRYEAYRRELDALAKAVEKAGATKE
jgi:hypothetical protein